MRWTTVLICCVLLAGCDGGRNGDARTPIASEPSSPPVASSRGDAGKELPKADRSRPLTEYLDINSDQMMLTYVVASKSATPLSDEDKLNRFSAAYFNETDAFKKRELAQGELPRIADAMRKYGSHDYYSVPVGPSELKLDAPTPVQIANVVVGDYDFAGKAFSLSSYPGVYCWSTPVRNEQGAMLRVLASDFPCSLPVGDEAQARAVESARSQGALDLKGRLYLFVPRAENGVAEALVAHARLELVHSKSQEVLAQFEW